LEQLAVWMAEASDRASAGDRAHYRLLSSDIGRFLERPHEPVTAPAAPEMPPGSPIGQAGMSWLGERWWGTGDGTGALGRDAWGLGAVERGGLVFPDLACHWR
jgi:hypothetical protein